MYPHQIFPWLALIALFSGCILKPLDLDGFPCTFEELCAPGQLCINGICRPQGTKPNACLSDRNCPNGQTCDNDTKACRLPNIDEPCVAITGCQNTTNKTNPLLCVNVNGNNICRRACDPLGIQPCAPGEGCTLLKNPLPGLDAKGVCLPLIKGQSFEQPCDQTLICEVQLQCLYDGEKSSCRNICNIKNPRCPSNNKCIPYFDQWPGIGVCLPNNCETNKNFCQGGTICHAGACRPPCNPNTPNTCSPQQFCFKNSDSKTLCLERECGAPGKICRPLTEYCDNYQCKKINPPTQTCQQDSDCPKDRYCIKTTDGVGHCQKICKLDQTGLCSTQELCAPISTTSIKSACLPPLGGLQAGSICSSTNPCEHGLGCVDLSNYSMCLKLCYTTQPNPCQNKDFVCQANAGESVGVCLRQKKDRNTGQTCGPVAGQCIDNHICILRQDQSATCLKECKLDSDCATSERCTSVSGTQKFVCFKP